MSENAPLWDVSVRKTVGSGEHAFVLDLAFRSDASRLVLFGPSGAGKSLTLKVLAGLLRPDAGRVSVGGTLLFDGAERIDIATRHRRVGYVFQEYALFPHLDVRQNVAFGLSAGWRNPRRAVASAQVDRWLEACGLGACASRFPDQLSGGQRQRTALARALAGEPRMLLLDEPFAALDASLRARLRDELGELQARSGVPTLLITHDEADVAAFADEVVEIDGGRSTGQQRIARRAEAPDR